MTYKPKVSEEKKKKIKELKSLAKKYNIIASIDLTSLPAAQLQLMRKTLKEHCEIFMCKRRLMKFAFQELEEEKPGIKGMISKLKGVSALIFTNQNPFLLYKTLEKSKSSAPAKPGQIAPKDIWVKAGPTGFAPGPIIGELGSVGIATGVEGGKIAIKKDKLIVKEGEIIPANVAAVLARLKIEPMEIGLNLVAAYENGFIYDRKILAIDEKEYINNIQKAYRWAFNLAIERSILNKETVLFLITKAFVESRAIALSQNILTKETVSSILCKAEKQAMEIKTIAKL